MAYQYFDASWVDVYNASGGWSKKHSSHPIRTGGGSGTNWQTFIRIPDAVKTAANQSTTSPSLDMQIYFSSASSEIDVGYHRSSSARSVGSTGLPWYAYSETWRSIGTGWITYGMSNWFLPNFLSGNTQGLVLYSYNGKFSNTAYGLGTSYNVRFRVTGTWNTKPSNPGSPRVDKSTADISQTFRWNASSDSEQSTSALRYDVEFYNGSSWSRQSTRQSGTTYTRNTTKDPQVTNARFRVRAYDGELYSSWSNSPTFVIKHVAPSFSSSQISYVDRNSTTTAITGNNQHIIQNASLPRAYVNTGASGNDGKSIVRYTFTLGGQEKSRTSTGYVDFGTLDASYNQTLKVTAEDSAGLKTSVTKSVTIIPYDLPSLQYSAKRVGSMSDETILKLSGSISPLGGKNSLGTTRFRYKTASGSYGSYQSFPRSVSGNSFTTTDRTLTLDNTQAWVIHVQVSDTLGTRDVYININSGTPVTFTDVDLESFGVGKYPTKRKSTEIAGETFLEGNVFIGNGKGEEGGVVNLRRGGNSLQLTSTTDNGYSFISWHKENGDRTGYIGVPNMSTPNFIWSNEQGGTIDFRGTDILFNNSPAFQSGSNANGQWVRFNDGTQIVWSHLTVAYQSGSYLGLTWTYPVPFIDIPVTTTNRYAAFLTPAYNRTFPSASNYLSTSIIRYWKLEGTFVSGENFDITAMAIGRWK